MSDMKDLEQSSRYKGVIRASDREKILDLAWEKDLTVDQAAKLLPSVEKRRKKLRAQAKKRGASDKPGGKGRSGGRRKGKSLDQLRKEAKGAPLGSPQRLALNEARLEEARARRQQKG